MSVVPYCNKVQNKTELVAFRNRNNVNLNELTLRNKIELHKSITNSWDTVWAYLDEKGCYERFNLMTIGI